jgi:myo-inositol-1(or 4)-monophosphatase
MTFSSLAQTLDQLLTLMRHVGHTEVMPHFLRTGFDLKADGSLLTQADLASQAALQSALPRLILAPVLGEEMVPEEQQLLWQANPQGLWIVDPIDGTTNFAHGIPYFALSVAFFQHGRPLLGAVYNPVNDEMFYASTKGGAYLNGQRLPITRPVASLQDAVAGLDVKKIAGRLPTRLLTNMPYSSQRTFGASTLDWCYLAAGRLDVYVHGGQKLWDYAAGSLILAEAGGQMASLYHPDYWQDDVWQRSVVAARDPHLFSAWSAWINANQ